MSFPLLTPQPCLPVPAQASPRAPVLAPETLHPTLWRAHQLGRSGGVALLSGFAELDAQLPGGGWPAGVLTELLLPHAGVGELRLLAPVLAGLQQQQRCVMWFDPPAAPCAWALSALGINLQRLVVVHARHPFTKKSGAATFLDSLGARASQGAVLGAFPHRARQRLPGADMLWALEQALKSGHLGAVLAWLPARLPADALRRLQLAAQAHEGPVFLLRDAQMCSRPSAAPLRLLLSSDGPDLLRVVLLKRRGPPQAQPLRLALPAVLSAPALARALRGAAAVGVSEDLNATPAVRQALPS